MGTSVDGVDRTAPGGSAVQGWPVQGFTTVVLVVGAEVVGTTAVELVVDELVVELVLELVVVVWAPAPPPAKSPRLTSSATPSAYAFAASSHRAAEWLIA